MHEKAKILKEIGVHDIDPKSPIYGHPVFKAAVVVDNDGEALTSMSQGLRLSSINILFCSLLDNR
jgi:hypothetical protein